MKNKTKNEKIALFQISRGDFWSQGHKNPIDFSKFLAIFFIVYLSLGILIFNRVESALAISSWEKELIDLTNSTRIKNNLAPLRFSQKLYRAALAKAQDLETNQYFDHVSLNDKTAWNFIEAEKYHYRVAGENLAIGFTEVSNIQKSWLASQDHRKNILDPDFKEIGIVVLPIKFRGAETLVVVEFLATR